MLAGIPLYLLANRHFGRAAAACGYLFLFCNALFLRVLLWDLTPFVSVPLAVAGIAIWLLAEKRRWLGDSSQAPCLRHRSIRTSSPSTAIGCFLAIEIALALRHDAGRRRLPRRLGRGRPRRRSRWWRLGRSTTARGWARSIASAAGKW